MHACTSKEAYHWQAHAYHWLMLVDHRLNKSAFVLAYIDQHAFLRNEAVYGVEYCLRVSLRCALLYIVQHFLL